MVGTHSFGFRLTWMPVFSVMAFLESRGLTTRLNVVGLHAVAVAVNARDSTGADDGGPHRECSGRTEPRPLQNQKSTDRSLCHCPGRRSRLCY